ncbi:MAG: signal peptide peptidase SppA [Acetobacteraceae bacterium]|nr:signal peptide peptidase SppA [Acetobacteraceae bacterium]
MPTPQDPLPDILVDRRRLKRGLGLWRAVAVLALLLALFLAAREVAEDALPGGGAHVARIEISGGIGTDRRLVEALDRAREDTRVAAVLLAIDSPGGSVAGGEMLHAAIARLAERKPVVALLGGTAASAGYMVALPAHRILAREATVTGSIGVILQTGEASELLRMVGIRAESIASGRLKGQPSLVAPLTDEARAALRAVVEDLHAQFVAMVVAARRLPEERVRQLADGGVLTGRQAVSAGLVDSIGGEREARAWLAAERGVSDRLPVRDATPRRRAEEWLGATLGVVLKSLFTEWLGVDLRVGLWQPPR